MAGKLSDEEVKRRINSVDGYRFISLERKVSGGKKRLWCNIKCDNHGSFDMTMGAWNQGQRCPKCGHKRKGISRKLSYKKLEKQVNDAGFGLIDFIYEGNRKRILLTLRCDKENHIFKKTLNGFRQNNRCPVCERGWVAYFMWRKEYEKALSWMKSYANDLGYEITTNDLPVKKIDLICSEKHTFAMTWANFYYNESRCPRCNNELQYLMDTLKDKDAALEYIRNQGIKRGFVLISTIYERAGDMLQWNCEKGHLFPMRWDHIRGNHGCSECGLGIHQRKANKMEFVYKKYKKSGDAIGGEFWDIIDESMFSMISIAKLKGPVKDRFKKLKVHASGKNISIIRLRNIRDEDIRKWKEFMSELITEFPDILEDNWGTIFDNIYINKICKYGVV